MPPKGAKKGKKSSADDDEELLLAQAEQAAKEAKKVATDKARAEQQKKAAEAKKAKEAADAAKAAAQALPPLLVNDVVKSVFDEATKKIPGVQQHGMRDCCWLSYIVHNVLAYAIEHHRKVALRPPSASGKADPEPVISFEVRDDKHPDDIHSWNAFTTKSGGVFVADLSLDQFLPSGRHGYKHDGNNAAGWELVKASARVTPAASDAPLPGLVAVDPGIIPAGQVTFADGLKAGAYKAHTDFMRAALRGNSRNMTKDQQAIASTLHAKEKANGMVSQWLAIEEAALAAAFDVKQ
eukprot:CAMPEP_0174832468 /NCGR_PEP_ID=MMETSP1114-20130205/3691_1 /TAXON_ID=312471 /ORGANISM="Neobodo designis, Strain CCAP 1951/1" /LENGTH=294 /DNA_ID=CAMNT_0016066327 /DNA_START=33 /DNA_END=917 /DNA_ORIENTATION=+